MGGRMPQPRGCEIRPPNRLSSVVACGGRISHPRGCGIRPPSRNPRLNFTIPARRATTTAAASPTRADAGVANPFVLGALGAGEDVLDVGCGAGMDTLIAAQMVGPTGSVTGLDMTPEMAAKARRSVAEMKLGTVTIVEGSAERMRFVDASFDVVISNGVIDLIPDKDAVFSEIMRVLRPGGRI